KHFLASALHLVRSDVLNVLPKRPFVAEWILNLTVAVAPELVTQWHGNDRASLDRPVEQSVDIFRVKIDHYCSGAQSFGRGVAHAWKLVRQHHPGVSDLERGVHQLAIWSVVCPEDLGPERILVEGHCLCAVVYHQVRGDRMLTIGYCFHLSCHVRPLCVGEMPGS